MIDYFKENSHNNGCLRDLSAGEVGNAEVQKYRNAEVQKYRNTETAKKAGRQLLIGYTASTHSCDLVKQ